MPEPMGTRKRCRKSSILPPRPRRWFGNAAGISTWNEYLRDLEKWAELAEKRIAELESNLGVWAAGGDVGAENNPRADALR